jgi:hypothetical protein
MMEQKSEKAVKPKENSFILKEMEVAFSKNIFWLKKYFSKNYNPIFPSNFLR